MNPEIDYENHEQVMNLIVANDELPRYFYKYTDIKSLMLILENSTLKFSKPSEFNDPFDCNLTIDTENTEEEIENYIDFLKTKKSYSAEQINSLKIKYRNSQERHQLTNNEIKKAKETFGVSCFSKTEKNLIMWAHYADKHRGVCLKFDILSDTDFFMTPFPIYYKNEYPRFNYLRDHYGLGKFLLETKSEEWNYESEIRVMKEGSGFYKFNKNSLVEIFLGSRVTNNERNAIIESLRKNGFHSSKTLQCSISATKFELVISN